MKERLITGIIGGILFISMVLIGGWIFTLFIVAVAFVAMIELLKMRQIEPFSITGFISILSMLAFLLPKKWVDLVVPAHVTKVEILIGIIVILLMITVLSKNSFTFDHVGFVILSSLYVGLGFHFLITARDVSEHGLLLVFFILILIWTTDSFAYFVGRKWGKYKLWPEISPKKTIEGSIGGIVAAFLIGTLFYLFVPDIFKSYLSALLVIFIVSTFGQIGDLVQSALKRHYEVKDSGTILPGHGGILDRFDSLIFVMPVLYLFHLI
ncbi:phosphatidate cytidylyltransferase [bacterium LRH843]|nr:phosphatidate cytidylyltransferase [bacterium LRH843]